MSLKHELSALVTRRIGEMGITSSHLAQLAQVRLERVEALLGSSASEISIAEAENIANAVGLAIGVFGRRRSREGDAQAFSIAAQAASTSFREVMPRVW